MNELNESINYLMPKLEKFDEFEKQIKVLELELSKIQNEKFGVEKNIARLEQQIKNIDNMISMLDREIENKKKSKEKIIYYDELVKWLDEYFIQLMETIEKHVMYNIQQEFNKFFQDWFGILMGEEMNVRIDEQFSPVIEQNGFETDYNNLSGGEKTSIALAYRLALNKVINIMIDSIKTKDLLILDEPTDGFSSEQLDRMRDVLDQLNLKQVIIVSHEPKIDTFMDNVLKVYKDGHVSRISS
jgi:exonuclease SbcC